MRLVWEKLKFFMVIGSGERMWVLTFITPRIVRRIEHIRCTGGETPEVLKLICVIDMRILGNYLDHSIYDIVIPTLTTSGRQRFGSTKTPEVPNLMWIVDLRILQDPSRSFDRGEVSINIEILWEPMCRVMGFPSVPLGVAHTGIQRTLERKLRAKEPKKI
jgi:hypothetical protein